MERGRGMTPVILQELLDAFAPPLALYVAALTPRVAPAVTSPVEAVFATMCQPF